MFYSNFVYVRDGPLAKVWLASHMVRKLDAKEIRGTNISFSIKQLKEQKTPLALRLCGQLLLGLARIYELKVKAASEEATTILKKIKLMIPESAAAAAASAARAKKGARKSSADKENDGGGVIDAAPAQLRAKNNAITNHLDSGLGLDGGFGSLGGGLADLDLDAMLDDPEGLVGEELQRALEGMGEPHLQLNLDDGSVVDGMDGLFAGQGRGANGLSLTQHHSSGGSVAASLFDEDAASKSALEAADMDLGGEEAGLIGEADPNEADLEDLMNNSVADGRREEELGSEAAGLNDISAATPLGKRKAAAATAAASEDFELDLSGGLGDFDEQVGGGGDDHVSAAAAASAALERTNAEIEEALDQLSALKASKRAAALLKSKKSSKRAKTAYVPVIDAVTEIGSATLKAWLADTSDITRPAGSGPRRGASTTAAGAGAAAASSSTSQSGGLSFLDRRLAAARAFMCEGLLPGSSAYTNAWNNANAGDFPSSTTGHRLGCMGPKIRALLRANYTSDVRLKHLPYREPTAQEIAIAAASAPPTPLSQGGALLDGVGDEALDFGAGAGEGPDPFAGAALAGDGTEFPDHTQMDDGGLGPMELDLGDDALVGVTGEEEEKEPENDEFFLHGAGAADFAEAILPTDDEMTRREKLDDKSDLDARLFFNENSKASSSQLLKESVESGWSRRTKRFHEMLVTEFKTSAASSSSSAKARKEVSLQHVIQGHFKATAAACLYQTLVLASSGFVKPTQAEEYGEIRIAKTATFDSKKLPKLPTQSQPLTETADSEMSPSL